MSIWNQKAKKQEQEFDVPPAGSHPAVLVGLIDLGTHEDEYQGKKFKNRQILLCWELTDQKIPGIDQNHIVSAVYSLSFGKRSNLRKMVETWKGSDFKDDEEYDLGRLLGKSCMVAVSHKTSAKDRVFAKLDTVTLPHKSVKVPPAKIKPLAWSLEDGTPIPTEAWVPSHVYGNKTVEVIQDSDEWKARHGGSAPIRNGTQAAAPVGAVAAEETEDSIPF